MILISGISICLIAVFQSFANLLIDLLWESIEMFCAIRYHLCNSKNVKTTRKGVVLLVKLQAASHISLQPQQIDHLILCLDTPLICLFLSLHNSYTYTLPVSVYLCTALIHSTLAKLTDYRITACTFFNSLKF